MLISCLIPPPQFPGSVPDEAENLIKFFITATDWAGVENFCVAQWVEKAKRQTRGRVHGAYLELCPCGNIPQSVQSYAEWLLSEPVDFSGFRLGSLCVGLLCKIFWLGV